MEGERVMSSIKYPSCGQNISKHANVCIWCKCPLTPTVMNAAEESENRRKIEAHKEKWEKKEEMRLAQIRAIESRPIYCPFCGSVNVRKTTFWSDFGLWQSVGKQWKCKDCRSYF